LVTRAVGSSNTTFPGPEILVQLLVTPPGGFGFPSSLTVPLSNAEAEMSIV